jgi:hypothetical protein
LSASRAASHAPGVTLVAALPPGSWSRRPDMNPPLITPMGVARAEYPRERGAALIRSCGTRRVRAALTGMFHKGR